MFQVICGSPYRMWYPVDNVDRSSWPTLYVGQIVQATSDGVNALGSASGVSDTGQKYVPFGVVIGTNLRTPAYSTASLSDSITAVQPHTTTTEFAGGNGPYIIHGDRSAAVEVALITPSTVLKGDIRHGAVSTALTVMTSGASSTGAGMTFTANIDFDAVAGDLTTVYCRSGANRGIYRVCTDHALAIKTFDHYWPYDIVSGDTWVAAPLRNVGSSYCNFNSTSLWIEADLGAASNSHSYILEIIELNLDVAGQEYAIFRFNGDQFCKARA